MKTLESKIRVFLNQKSWENIESSYHTIVGIDCNPSRINENGKNTGRIILLHNIKKNLDLHDSVEFLIKKSKWESPIVENRCMVLLDQYWVRPYRPNPKIPCLVKIFKPKTGTVETEVKQYNYRQFFKRRLVENLKDWSYGSIMAVENYRGYRQHGHITALNSTVRNYFVDKDSLITYIAKYDNIIREINREWKKLMNKYWEDKYNETEV